MAHDGEVEQARFTPDGRRVVSVTAKGMRVWEADSGLLLREVSVSPRHLAFSGDSSTAVTISASGGIQVWRRDFAEELSKPNRAYGGNAALAFDGSLVCAWQPVPWVGLFDAATGRMLGHLKDPGCQGAVFSRDKRCVVTSTVVDGVVRVWDVATTGLLLEIRPKDSHDPLLEACLANDDEVILTRSFTGIVRAWAASDGRTLFTIPARNALLGRRGTLAVDQRWQHHAAVATRPRRRCPIREPRELTIEERRRYEVLRPR